MMSKFIKKPTHVLEKDAPGRFERFNLLENPFPSEPVVNKDSSDKRINGEIFEVGIRSKEYSQIESEFLKKPQADPNHLRLGYIIDTSYIGRGNGKSAFLVNLNTNINREFCLDISEDQNKVFSVIVTPEPGGRTKTFPAFVDLIFKSILNSKIIEYSLAILKYTAITEAYPELDMSGLLENDESFLEHLCSKDWYKENDIDLRKITNIICRNEALQSLPPAFPIFRHKSSLMFVSDLVKQKDFESYYIHNLKHSKDKMDFLFSHLIRLFQAASFNGAYILVDDFERVPDFQSSRQKKDFALELRTCLFDGMYLNAKIGFFNFLLVLHAGVPRLISESWSESGLENRSPISSQTASNHSILFEKLTKDHAVMLLKRYLDEYRIDHGSTDSLFPFTEGSIMSIGQKCEFNASKMLKAAYDLLDKAADNKDINKIDNQFIIDQLGGHDATDEKKAVTIDDAESMDLLKKANEAD